MESLLDVVDFIARAIEAAVRLGVVAIGEEMLEDDVDVPYGVGPALLMRLDHGPARLRRYDDTNILGEVHVAVHNTVQNQPADGLG